MLGFMIKFWMHFEMTGKIKEAAEGVKQQFRETGAGTLEAVGLDEDTRNFIWENLTKDNLMLLMLGMVIFYIFIVGILFIGRVVVAFYWLVGGSINNVQEGEQRVHTNRCYH